MTSSSRKRRRVSSQKKAAVETNMEQLESQVEAQPNMDLAEEFGEDNNLDMETLGHERACDKIGNVG